MTSGNGHRDGVPAEATYRLLLATFPRSWRERHAQEALAILLNRAVADRFGRAGVADSLNLIWHAVMARLALLAQPALRRLPQDMRPIPGTVALVLGSIGSVIMLTGEIAGAQNRPAHPNFSQMFLSGPFLTIGAGIDIGFIMAMILTLARRIQLARLALFATTALALWMTWPGGLEPYPQPATMITGAMAALGLIALLGFAQVQPVGRNHRLVMIMTVTIGSVVTLGLLARLGGLIGWAPLETYSTSASIVAYLTIGLPITTVATIVIYKVIRHRDHGGLLLLALTALAATTTNAIAQTLGSESATTWLWPAGCLILTITIATYFRRTLQAPRPATARG